MRFVILFLMLCVVASGFNWLVERIENVRETRPLRATHKARATTHHRRNT